MGPIALGNLHDLPGTLKKIFSNLFLWGGVLFFTVAFFSFLTLLSWANLSFVLPATALSYLVNTFAARFVLNERVPVGRWLGTIFIGMGVALLSLGPIAVR